VQCSFAAMVWPIVKQQAMFVAADVHVLSALLT